MSNHEPAPGNKEPNTTDFSHRTNLEDIETTTAHDGSVLRKALIKTGEVGELATVNVAWLEAGQELAEHDHPDCFEFYLFLEGTGVMKVGEETMDVGQHDFVTVRPTELHSLQANDDPKLGFITWRAKT